MPIIAATFAKGPAEDPASVLERGLLRATDEPQDAKLAEAYCSEGCCGALYVKIFRDGPDVVWADWPAGVVRFAADCYDREIARAERDHGWEWPARTAARLLSERLRADPVLLGRWDCALHWSTSWLRDYHAARLVFDHPAAKSSPDDPQVQFGIRIDVGERDSADVVAEVVEQLRETDPKSVAELISGGKEDAEKLGLVFREPVTWR